MSTHTELTLKAHDHEWVVFSTALSERWLMLQCVTCGAMATIDDPSVEEWERAFASPRMPYQWTDDSRVMPRPRNNGKVYVVRAAKRQPCHCVCRLCIDDESNRRYDRFPAEIVSYPERLTSEDREEINNLASFVDEHPEMCSATLPYFFKSFVEDTGTVPCKPLVEIVRRIAETDEKEMHMAAPVVARVLRTFSDPV